MLVRELNRGKCKTYLVACEETGQAALIDPLRERIERYLALAAYLKLELVYAIDTHTHADHFSATRQLARQLGVPVVMQQASSAPFVDMRIGDGEMIIVGKLRLQAIHTPGHTRDSMCLRVEDRLFTGDTLLIGATGRTDLPSGDPEALYDSLFHRLLRLDPGLRIFPAHDYKGRQSSTIGQELATNPRLQKRDREAFVEMMRSLNFSMPTHVTEALRTNMSGGKSVAQLLAEAAARVPFMSFEALKARIDAGEDDLIVLDVREREMYAGGHVPGARILPRGQLELRVNQELPDPTRRILTCCELGHVSTLAAATLREMGFLHTVAMDGGMKAWREAGYPLTVGDEP